MNRTPSRSQRGITLVEMMVALSIGLIVVGAVISVYLAQSQVAKSSNAQASIQSAENAIAAMLVPSVRGAGFTGCGTVSKAISNLVTGGPAPVGTLNGAVPSTLASIIGYDYTGTAGASTSYSITALNAANGPAANGWIPSLDTTLLNHVIPGSDVVVAFGPATGAQPTGVTAVTTGNAINVTDTSGFTVGTLAAVSDCLKSSVFLVTAKNATTLTHGASAAVMNNATASLSVNYQPGAQVVPLQQTAYFVSQDTNGGQSVLTRATLTISAGGGGWTFEPLVPGVESMQALYGVNSGTSQLPQVQYFAANGVTDWTQVVSVRLAFLIEGQAGSKQVPTAASSFDMLGTAVTPPSDSLTRHVYEVTINLRNSTP